MNKEELANLVLSMPDDVTFNIRTLDAMNGDKMVHCLCIVSNFYSESVDSQGVQV